MGTRTRQILARAWVLTTVIAISTATVVMLELPSANAQPVQYVKTCSGYGAGFFYLPGTSICVNVATDDAQEAIGGTTVSKLPACPSRSMAVNDATDPDCTAGKVAVGGGTNSCIVACVGDTWQFTGLQPGVAWRWRIPNNPRTWVTQPKDACAGGQLVKFGDITRSGLIENSYLRYETRIHYRLKLRPHQYIATVLYEGGFTGVGSGNFCMYYYYNDPKLGPAYSPLGCIDTAAQANVPAALAFPPDATIPPTTDNPTYIVGANGEKWDIASASDIGGELWVWLCLQNAAPSFSWPQQE